MVNEDFAEDQNRIKMFLKQRAEAAKALDNDLNSKTKLYPLQVVGSNLENAKRQLIDGAVVPKNFKHYSYCSCYVPNPNYPRPTMELAEIEMLSEMEARSELARLCVLVRK